MPSQSPRRKNLRFAFTLNLLFPGLGQLYLGQMIRGLTFALGFLTCFVAMLALFLRAYANYLQLSTSGNLLEQDNLEQLAQTFPTPVLVGLLIVALAIYLASLLSLAFSRNSQPRHPPADP
jgi:hypothetical protein